ncbi:MFS transporter [Pantoea piersonii]|jgi:DHA2 family multidrug resistance protein|uniref:MFS transporter n=1 Tax=Pantoea piersonii TaxID=2364647 RepID=UPI00196AF71B|nr:MFS transporter [Pantoea piersonii]MBZ6386775.1 MFS transporter [Pantoea piersonii]MBZ6400076.1 MFS transporter [Pantoea piersonii]MBZ6410078.1 MFS transporter [Pantoea piersonii]MBZ6426127.1 MFS transporter [Pantoea piersonii]
MMTSVSAHDRTRLTKDIFFPLTIALCVGLEFFDSTFFSFYARYIAGGINAPADELVWSTSLYAVASVVGILQQSWLIERIGYRAYLTLCLLGFSLASLLVCFTSSSAEMATLRSVQGYCMGPMLSICRIILQFSLDGKMRGLALKLFLFCILLSSAAAPLIGGYLIGYLGWRTPFAAMSLTGGVIALMVFYVVPQQGKSETSQRTEAHFWPYIIFTLAIISLQTVMQQVQFQRFTSAPFMPLLTGAGLMALGWFTYHQWRHPRPLLNLRTFRTDLFRTGLVMYMLYYYINNSMGYLISRMLEGGLNYPVQNAGLLVGGTSLLALSLMFLYFRFAPKIKNKKLIIIPGWLIAVVIAIWMLKMPPDVSEDCLLIPLFLRGGLLLTIALPVGGSAFSLFSEEDYSHSYRLKNIVKQLTYSFSTASVIMLEQEREALHYSRLAEAVTMNNIAFQNMMGTLSGQLTMIPETEIKQASLVLIQKMVISQSEMLSVQDGFLFLAAIALIAGIFSLWQRKI